MQKITVIIALCGLMAACSPSQEAELAKIAEFEKSEKTGTKEGLEELALLHKAYGMEYTDAQANDYLYAAGQYYFYEKLIKFKRRNSTPTLELEEKLNI